MNTTTTTTRIPTPTYRQTQSGEWVVFGHPTLVHPNSEVAVRKRDGNLKWEEIDRIGKVFETPDGPRVYGYIRRRTYVAARSDRAPGGRRCPECGSAACARAWDPRGLCDED